MVNGLPGNMASEVVKAAADSSDVTVVPFSLTGPEIEENVCSVSGIEFRLIRPEDRDKEIDSVKEDFLPFISIDFSHPAAVNDNADFYCRHELPFVMGTTGGDREKLRDTVSDQGISAVIAPNMAKQIVGLQLMLEYAARNFPDLFSGYSMTVRESHQKGKADTSGTAKSIVEYFTMMGIPFSVEDIDKTRDPEIQKTEWGVPAEYLGGHAYHTYTVTSGDGTADFQFRHNVRGRRMYALGTLDAVRFLHNRMEKEKAGCYSMIDVLKAGEM